MIRDLRALYRPETPMTDAFALSLFSLVDPTPPPWMG